MIADHTPILIVPEAKVAPEVPRKMNGMYAYGFCQIVETHLPFLFVQYFP
jgi:hypothetical protein